MPAITPAITEDCSLDDRGRIEALLRENAYYIWEQRGREGKPGTSEDDWAAAEKYIQTFPQV